MLETVDLYGKHAIIEKKKSRRGGGCHRRPRESPIFGPFQDGSLWTTNKVSSISRDMISQLLADAIPAETLPAGYEGVPKWNDDESISVNKNMASEFKDNLQIYFWASDKKWIHSFFVQAPYMVVHRLFEDIATKTREIE